MHRIVPLVVLSSFFLLLPGHAFVAEPPKDHEKWHGSLGALWIDYPFDCAVWNDKKKRIFQCHDADNVVNLTINPSADPLLSVQGTILQRIGEARAVQQGNTLTISGTYDDQSPALPITIGGSAEDFTFHGTYDTTPFQGKGSYKPNSLHVSLSFTKYFPITGTLDLRRTDNALPSSSSSSEPVAFSTNTETGMILSATGTPLVTSGSTMDISPPVTLLSSGTIEMATQRAIVTLQDSGQALMGFSRVLTLIFQTIFAVLVIFLLITFGFLLHQMKDQRAQGDTPK